jgi:hypothetical protein
MSEQRNIYLRAHTVKVVEDHPKKPRKKKSKAPPEDRLPERCLIFDTEVRTIMNDKHDYQKLTFGFFRICILVNGSYLCEREGIFYSGEGEPEDETTAKFLRHAASARLDKEELNAIGHFVSTELPDVEIRSYPPKLKLEVYQTFSAFMEKVFWHAVRKGWLVSCFNSPWDLSRLCRAWRPSRKGDGFSLIMGHRFWRKTQTWVPDPYRPMIRIEPKNARVAFISRGRPKYSGKGKKGKKSKNKFPQWDKPAHFLDREHPSLFSVR